jgi:hypothetical protein
MAASRYKVELSEDISVTVKVSDLKRFANSGRRIKYKHLRVKRDEEQQNLFHIYNKLVHWDVEDDLRYVLSIEVTLVNDEEYQLEKIQANPSKKIDYIEKDYDNCKFSNVRSTEIGQKEVGEILDKLDHPDVNKVEIKLVKQVEKVNYSSLGMTEWYFKVGVNDKIVKITQRDSKLQDILDVLAEAQDSIKAGMSDHEAQAYYLEPLKDDDWNEVEVYQKEAV